EEKAFVDSLFLLTSKPTVYAANVDEDSLSANPSDLPLVQGVCERAAAEGAEVVLVSAAIEEEIAGMDYEDGRAFLEEMGLEESGLDRLVRHCYRLLGLISYLTAGEKEVRAWTITAGTKAPQAAGKIHTDFERGFIRAEVIKYDDYTTLGSEKACRDAGKIGIEGKEYVVQDGDIMHFLFNV
ncbi:MAG: DUF933 domain-containing protein, partial [Alistipes sp.]|nr:DUF933 domain-containing protein [Alistipes sp.]